MQSQIQPRSVVCSAAQSIGILQLAVLYAYLEWTKQNFNFSTAKVAVPSFVFCFRSNEKDGSPSKKSSDYRIQLERFTLEEQRLVLATV